MKYLTFGRGLSLIALFVCLFSSPVTAQPPSVQTSSIIATDNSSTEIALSWTRGNGLGGVTVLMTTNIGAALPSMSGSYSANSVYGLGQNVNTDWFVVFDGNASGTVVTGLSPNIEYKIYANEWSFPGPTYHNGTNTGNPINHTTLSAGNSALDFDGVDDHILAGNLGTLPTQGTFEAWVWSDFNDSNHGIMDTDIANTSSGFRIENNSSNDLYLYTDNAPAFHYFYTGNQPTSQWFHLAFTWNTATNSLIGYVNGVQVFNDVVTVWPSSLPALILGTSYDNVSATRKWDGRMDEVRMWQTQRTVEQINAFKDVELTGSEPGLILYYDFSEGTGTATADDSGNGFFGTLTNGPTWVTTGPTLGAASLDTTPPTVAISGPSTVNGAFVAAFTFSEAVQGFILSDILVTNGTPSNLQQQTPTEYTVDITPTSEGLVLIDINSGTFTDFTGNANTSPAPQFSTTYDVQYALSFNGTSAYVSGTGINLANSDFTIEAWYNTDNPTGENVVFALGSTGSNNQALHVVLRGNTSQVLIGFFFSDVTIPYTLTSGWHHFAVTHDVSTLTSSVFIDGVFIGSAVHPSGAFTGNSNFFIGRLGWSASGYFDGLLDEVRVWNTTRTVEQINYFKDVELDGAEPGLVAYYPMEVSGTLTDLAVTGASQNGSQNGTITAATQQSSALSLGAADLDTVGPTASIVSSESDPTSANPIEISFVFDEPVIGLSTSDLSVTNGSVTNLGTLDNSTWTADLVPGSVGLVTVQLPADAVTDVTGNGNAISNAFSRTYETPTNFSLAFDGADDVVVIPDTDNSLDIVDEFTIEAWVNVTDQVNNTIIDKGDYSYLFQTHANGAGNALGFYNNSLGWRYSTGTINTNEWTHVAVTFSTGADELKFYINGVLQSTFNGVANPTLDNLPINIGRQDPASCVCNNFNGQMDELRIWNVALSVAEINAGKDVALTGNEPDLIAYWDFNDGNGSILTDVAGINDGTLTHFALSGSTSNWVTDVPFGGAPDVTAPVINSLTPSAGSTTISINYNLSESSTLYYLVINDGGAVPTVNNVRNSGTYSDEPNLVQASSLVAGTNGTLNISGLNPEQTYDIYIVAQDAATNLSLLGTVPDVTTNPSNFALAFDGANDNVRIPHNTNLNPGAELTLEAWVYRTADQYGTILAKWDDEGDNRGYMMNFGEHDISTVSFLATPSGAWDGNQLQWNTNAVVNLNEWHHIALTYTTSGANNVKFYLDGTLTNQTTWNFSIDPGNPIDVLLGGYDEFFNGLNAGAASRFFAGRMDEVRIWNVAKSPTEINDNMNLQLTGTEPGLVAYYDFSNASGTTLTDVAGTNDGTLLNFTLSGTTSNWVNSGPALGATPPDTTPPVINLLSVVSTGATTLDIDYEITESSTLYYLVINDGGATPSVNNVINSGTYSDEPNLVQDGFVSSATVGTLNLTGLTAGSTYDIYFVAVDGAANQSSQGTLFNVSTNIPNYALDFDGADDYVNLGLSFNSVLQGTNQLTVEAWVYRTANKTFHTIVGNYASGALQFLIRLDNDKPTFWVSNTGTPNLSAVGATSVPLNTWTHLAGTYDGSTIRVYMNGVLDGSTAMTGPISAGSASVTIGGNPGAPPGELMQGVIDDVRVWTVARTQQQIANFKNEKLFGSELGLLAYHDFSAGPNSGFTWDVTSNGYNGVLQNMDAATDWVVATYLQNPAGTTDGTSPTPIINSVTSEISGLNPFQITIAFDEAVVGFDASDITVVNGIASNLQTSNSTTFTADITPIDAKEVTIVINAGVAQDVAGNANVPSNQWVVDFAYNTISLAGITGGPYEMVYQPMVGYWEVVIETSGVETFSYRINSDPAMDHGDSDPWDGILENGGTPIYISGSGIYSVKLYPATLGYSVQQINSLGVLGSAFPNGWSDPDLDLIHQGNGVYELAGVELLAGEFKFRANDGWALNWGDNVVADGELDSDGQNIQSVAGNYTLSVDLLNRTYSVVPSPNNALDFDGVDDYVTISAAGLPTGNAPRTIEAWIKTNSTNSQSVIGWGENSFTTNTRFQLFVNSGVVAIIGESNDMFGSIPVNDGVWHHVAIVHDGNTSSIYVDGVLDVRTNKSYNTGSDVFALGKRTWANDEYFNGQLDNVRIWSEARTHSQLVLNATGTITSASNLIAAYYFNATSGSSLVDDSGSGRVGTLSNFALSGGTSNWVTSTTPECLSDLFVQGGTVDISWSTDGNWCGGTAVDIASSPTQTIFVSGNLEMSGANASGEFVLFNTDLVILEGATLNINFQGTGLTLSGSSKIINYGNLNLLKNVTFNNDSDILNYGQLNISNPIFFNGVNDILNVPSGAVLRGTNTINGSLVVAIGATFAPGASPGCTPITGDYTTSGTLEIELGGTIVCDEYDQVQVTGTANLGGTLDVILFGGYNPLASAEFTIIDAAAISGTFGTVNLPSPNWAIQYNYPNAGEVTLVYTGVPPGNYALSMDGVNDRIDVSTMDIPVGDFTLEAWVNYQGDGSATYYNIIEFSNDDPWFGIEDGSLSAYTVVSDPAPFTPNVWTHVAMTFNTTNDVVKLYVNGTEVASAPYFDTFEGTPMGIGGQYGGVFESWVGLIDEVRVWEVERSQAQLQGGMSGPLVGNEAGLVAYYNFNEGGGTSLDDLTANNHTANMFGFDLVNDWVAGTSFSNSPTPPSAPTNLIAYASSPSEITLQWTDNATNETSYRIEVADDFAFTTNVQVIDDSRPANSTSYVFSFGSNQRYFFRVTPVNGAEDAGSRSTVEFASTHPFPAYALSFNGSTDHVSLSAMPLDNYTGPFTAEAWVYSNDFSDFNIGYGGGILRKMQGEIVGDFAIGVMPDGRINFMCNRTGGNDVNGLNFSTATITTGVWNHIAVTFDGTNKHIYINGVESGFTTGQYQTGWGTAAEIGRHYGSPLYHFGGLIDEVKIWNVAKSDFSDRSSPVLGNESGLVAYYPLDENTGTKVVDRTINTRNGDINGAVYTAVSNFFNPPAAPTNLIAYQSSAAEVFLNWTDNATDETGHLIEWASDFAFTNIVGSTTAPANTVSAQIAIGTNAGRFFRVTATNGAEDASSRSAVEFASTVTFPGYALNFDGADDVVTVVSPTNLPTGSTAFTIEAWIKPNAHSSSDGIVSWGNTLAGQFNGLRLATNESNPYELKHYFYSNDLTANTGIDLSNEWHHVAVTYDGTTRRLFLDGVQIGSDNPVAPNVQYSDISIGKTAGSEYFDGGIDEVRIWNFAKADFNDRNITLLGNESGLVGYYKMDENTGSKVIDRSVNQNNGDITGALFVAVGAYEVLPPVITSVSPSIGISGISIVINGSNFGSNIAANRVMVGGSEATVTSANAAQLAITLPDGMKSYANVSVTNLETGLQAVAEGAYQVTFPSGNVIGSASYDTSNLALGERAGQDAVVGDFNNDDNLDFIAVHDVNSGSSNLRLATGNGVGGFSYSAINVTNIYTKHAAAADFDNDGNLDFVVGDRDNSFSVVLGNGDGTFTLEANYPGYSQHNDVATGDFNEDGYIDVALSRGSGNITVFLNDGTGAMLSGINYTVGGSCSQLAVADFDGDGIVDIGTVSGTNFAYILGLGDGTFSAAISTNTGQFMNGLVSGDFDQDGSVDVVGIQSNTNANVISMLNDGTGEFGLNITYHASGIDYPTFGVTGDFNGDGSLDVAFGSNSTHLKIMLGDGGGNFAPVANIPASTGFMASLDEGDFNNDGRTDIVAANYSNSPGDPTFDVYLYQDVITNFALNFDGSEYVNIPHASEFNFSGGDFTISFWVNPTGANGELVSKRANASAQGLLIGIFGGNYTIWASGAGGGWNIFNTVPFAAVDNNTWTHIAVAKEGGNWKFYKNGTLVETLAGAGFGDNTEPFSVGRDLAGVGGFVGAMDELQIWNTARSESTIALNYQSYLLGTEPGLVAYYRFNDGTGSDSLADLAASPNTGSLVNFETNTDWIASGVNVLPPAVSSPTAQAYQIEFSNIGDNSVDISWTNGDGQARVVLMYQGVDTPPTLMDNFTYGADPEFGLGFTVGSGWHVVANGVDNGVQVTGLSSNAEYTVAVYEYNGTAGQERYLNSNASNNPNTFMTTSGGLTNPALAFAGGNQFVGIDDSPSFDIDTDWTIEAWIKTGSTGQENIIAQFGGQGYTLFKIGSTLYFQYTSGGFFQNTGNAMSATENFADNQWHHVAVSQNGTNGKMYVDGVPVFNFNSMLPIDEVSDQVHIGYNAGVGSYTGSIDEVRFWDHQRSDAEILADYDNYLMGSETGLVAYYTFNEGGGLGAGDYSGNNNSGILYNGPTPVEGPVLAPPGGGPGPNFFENFNSGLPGSIGTSDLSLSSGTWTRQGVQSVEDPMYALGETGDAAWIQSGLNNHLTTPVLNNATYITFWYRAHTVGFDGAYFDVYGSADSGTTFTILMDEVLTNVEEFNEFTYNFGGNYSGPIRIIYNPGGDAGIVIDDFESDGTVGGGGTPEITVITPNGGEELQQNNEQYVYWQETNISGSTQIVIEYSIDLGDTWNELATGTSTSFGGQYMWYTDELDYPVGQYLIRVRTASNSAMDVSDAPFEIIAEIPTAQVSIRSLPVTGGAVTPGQTDVLIYKMQWDVSIAQATTEGLYLTLGGDFLPEHFDGFQLLMTVGSDDIGSADPIGMADFPTEQLSGAPDSSMLWFFEAVFNPGDLVHFYVLADVATTAPDGTTFGILQPDVDMNFGIDGADRVDLGLAVGSLFNVDSNAQLEAPTTQAFAIDVTNITDVTATVSWSNGNGNRRIVAIREGSGGFPAPTNDAIYIPKTAFGEGDAVGTGWFVVYNGTGASVTIDGLTPEVSYSVAVLEYNTNIDNETRYNTNPSELNPRSFTSAPPPNVALHFDGVDDHAEVLYDSYLNLGATFSIEAYVKPGAINSGFRAILDKRDAGTNHSNFSMSVIDGTDFGMFINNGTQSIFQTVPDVLQVGQWTLLSATFDGSTLKMYVDGHLVHTFQSTVTFANLAVPVQIGRSAQNAEYFNGELDEVRIWTNVLKPDEVAANTGKELVGDEFGLIAYYNFDDGAPEGTNTSVLTLNNGATVSATRPLDASIKNIAGTGSTSNFVLSEAFDISAFTPGTQASNVVFSNITTSSVDISWTNGNGQRRVVAVKQGVEGNVADLSELEYYLPNATYSLGERTAEQGWYIVYNGTGNAVTVTGLTSGATYSVAVMEANGPANFERYNLNADVDNPASVTIGVPTPDVTLTTLTLAGASLRQGKTDNLIFKFKMNVAGGNILLNSITLPVGGTAGQTAFDLNGFKLYQSIGQDNFNLATSTLIGSVGYNLGNPTWPVNQTYASGDVYFYVTANIAVSAVPEETFFIEPELVGIDVQEPKDVIDGDFSAGSTFTIEQTPSVTFFGSPTFGVSQEVAPGSIDNPVYRFTIRIDRDTRMTGFKLPYEGSLLASDVSAVSLLVGLDENDLTHPHQGDFFVASGTVGISEINFTFDRTFVGPEVQADTLLQFWVDVDFASSAVVNRTFTGIPVNTNLLFSDIVFRSGTIGQGLQITVLTPDPYCDPDAAFVPATVGPRIDNVTIANINNTTTGSNDVYYNNYSNLVAGVIANTTVPIAITGNSTSSGFVKVWVDWNRDLVLDENTELVIDNAPYTGTETLNLNINVPAGASIGTTRMRIYTYTTGERLGGACSGGTPFSIFGQVEDYSLSVLEPSGATLALNASNVGYFNFRVNWVAQPGANFYRLDIAEDVNFTKMLVSNVGVTNTHYDYGTGLLYDKDYYYRVRVAYPSGVSQNSNIIAVRTLRDQYTAQDSAALVLIYNTTEGNSWSDRDGWKASGRRLSTWSGVTMTGTRVTAVNLSGRGLTGEIPSEFTHINALNQVTSMDVSGNELYSLGAIGSLTELTSLNASDNYLVFNDLEPLVGAFDTFNYSPQKPVGASTRVVVPRGSNHTVTFTTQAADTYQWNRNGVPISGAFGTSYEVQDIRYETMGDFSLSMTDADVPGLTLQSADQTVLASGGIEINVRDLDGLPLDQGVGYLLKIEEPGQPFDTTVVANFTEGDLFFDVTILGDYIISVEADPEIYLPTYYVETFLWEEADTLFFRDVAIRSTMNMTVIPGERDPEDVGRIGGYLEIDVPDEDLRQDARRRAANVRCHVRRRTTGGRELNDPQYVLIASVVTDENGEFDIPNLPPGFYRINFEYPGIPMDQNSFVEFAIGADGDNSVVQLAAAVTENGIYVEQILPLPVGAIISDLKVYPNPVTDILKVAYAGLESNALHLVLYDMTGRIVKDQQLPRADAHVVEMPMADLKGGLYFLNVLDQSSGQIISTFKVMVRR